MTRDVALKDLVVDTNLYPRHNTDDTHISDLARALASGSQMPPIIAEEGTNRIVDGVHRRSALMRFLGEDAIVPVEFRTYESDSALFLEAVALNAVHGRKLDRHDHTRIVLKLREFGIEDRQISITLKVPEPIVEKLAVRIVHSDTGEAVPAKRGMEHLHGQTLNDSQIAAVGSVRSAEVGRMCLEMIRLLEARVVNLQDAKTVQRLRELSAVIDATLQSIAA